MFAYLLLTLGAASCINAQAVTPGPCPEIPGVDAAYFNFTKLLGTWYGQAQMFQPIESNWRCERYQLNSRADGSIEFIEEGINKFTEMKEVAVRTANVVSGEPVATINVTDVDTIFGNVTLQSYIVSTDFTCYWIEYTSLYNEYENECNQFSFILTRDPIPKPCCQSALDNAFQQSGIDRDLLGITDQTYCRYD